MRNNSNAIQALWVGIGNLSSFALGLISAAILSRYFDKTEYGTYRQILYVYHTLLVVFSGGLPRVFSYFLPRYELNQGWDIVWRVSKVLFLGGVFFSITLFSLSGIIADILKNPELSRGLKYFSPVPMFLLPTLGIEGIFSTYRKTIYIAIYNTASRLLMLMFIVLPVILFGGTYINAIYGWILVSFISLFIAVYFKRIPFLGLVNMKSGLSFKEILSYSLPLVSATIAGIAFRSANQFYISRYFGPEVFAEFSNGFMEIPFVAMITSATSTVLMPVFSKISHDKSDISQLTNMWRSALQKSAILIYPMVVFFMFYSKEVIILVYSEAYLNSSLYFSTAMVLNFFNIIIFAPLLLAFGKVKFYARLHIGLAVSAWMIGYLMVLTFNSPISIAISHVIIAICGILISLLYSARIIRVTFWNLFPIGRFTLIALHSVFSIMPVFLILRFVIPQQEEIITLLFAVVGFLIILLLTSRLVGINYLGQLKQVVNLDKVRSKR